MGFDLYLKYERLLGDPSLVVDTRTHLRYFRHVAAGNVLEIGVDVGNSTTAFLLGVSENGGHLYGIDINKKSETVFAGNKHWTFFHASSKAFVPVCKHALPELDVLYIDGDHSYEGAAFDINTYGPMVKKGGLILVHDVDHPDFPGVRRAFDEHSAERKDTRHGSWGLGVIHV